MNCDDAGGHALDKYGDMIGEGDNGLGHDKEDLCDDVWPHMACPLSPFYWPDGRVGRVLRHRRGD